VFFFFFLTQVDLFGTGLSDVENVVNQ